MRKIKEILEGTYNNPELRKRKIPLFMGKTGIGKTWLIEEFAKEKGVRLEPLVLSQRNPFEISGMGMPDKEHTKMMFLDFDTLTSLEDGSILFLDELTNCNPVVLNATLTLLEQRTMISGKKLADIMIIAAGNYEGSQPMTAAQKRRFEWIDVKFDGPMWRKFMLDKYQMPKSISSELCNLIKKEEFGGYNFHTPADHDKAIETILHNVYSTYEDDLLPYLNKVVPNPFEEDIIQEDKLVLAKDEHVSWLKLKQMGLGVLPIDEYLEEKQLSIVNEIEMQDENGNIIGEVKNIETLKKMYYFSDEKIKNIENGIKTHAGSPEAVWWRGFIFQKKIKLNEDTKE